MVEKPGYSPDSSVGSNEASANLSPRAEILLALLCQAMHRVLQRWRDFEDQRARERVKGSPNPKKEMHYLCRSIFILAKLGKFDGPMQVILLGVLLK